MKVALLNERHCSWYSRSTAKIKTMLPFYQREGNGYVHRVRHADSHYDGKTGLLRHTSVGFWCGSHGFIYPAGKWNRKHAYAVVCSQPSLGRVVCATCEARAIGSGQVGSGKIGDHFVKFRPRSDFFGVKP